MGGVRPIQVFFGIYFLFFNFAKPLTATGYLVGVNVSLERCMMIYLHKEVRLSNCFNSIQVSFQILDEATEMAIISMSDQLMFCLKSRRTFAFSMCVGGHE